LRGISLLGIVCFHRSTGQLEAYLPDLTKYKKRGKKAIFMMQKSNNFVAWNNFSFLPL
jgi:hypothetical protein